MTHRGMTGIVITLAVVSLTLLGCVSISIPVATSNETTAARLLGVQSPIQVHSIEYYADGGSLGLNLEDASGKRLWLFLCYRFLATNTYGQISRDSHPLQRGSACEYALGVLLSSWLRAAVGAESAITMVAEADPRCASPAPRRVSRYAGDPFIPLQVAYFIRQIERNQLGERPAWREVEVEPHPDYPNSHIAYRLEWETLVPCD